jgi:hypothetical protein
MPLIIAPTIHGNKLVSIRVTVNFDTRKIELLLWGRKLQSSTEHYQEDFATQFYESKECKEG